MPLYMDFHTIADITIKKIRKAHIADQAVQNRYHVKYHQFWVNEAAGIIFCLMEGPDKEACEKAHRETHGNIACKIVEVVPGMYHLFMGESQQINRRLLLHEAGTTDVNYRFVLVIDFTYSTQIARSSSDETLKLIHKLKTLALGKINKCQGKEIKHSEDDGIIAVFMNADDAVKCAVEMHAGLMKNSKGNLRKGWNTSFKTGISGGKAVTKNGVFLEEIIKLAQRLSLIAGNRQIIATTLVEKMSSFGIISNRLQSIRIISYGEEKFLSSLFDIAEDKLTDKNFSIECLGRDMGISRPQLYRKIMAIAGCSPNSFIRSLRMQKAFSLIRKKQYNISEVALEVGIHNPSYFSKCFQEKYGIMPSRVMA